MFTMIKTAERMVLNDKIHRYPHRWYVINPATGRKKEYHSRVSPMVRNGGRSSDIHKPRINTKNTPSPNTVRRVGNSFLLLRNANTEATAQRMTDATEKYIKESQVILIYDFTPKFPKGDFNGL